MKAICIPVFNRPELLRQTLASIGRNDLADWRVYLLIEPTSHTAAISDVIDEFVLRNLGVTVLNWVNGRQLGCDLNSFAVCKSAINDGAQAVLFMDDDILLSPDALEMCNWYYDFCWSPEHIGLALCRKDGNDRDKPEMISASDTAMGHLGQGWFFKRSMWFDFILRNWWAYDTTQKNWPDCYDWALCWEAQKQHRTLHRPRFSRARHNGWMGFHGPGPGVFPDAIATGKNYKYKIE